MKQFSRRGRTNRTPLSPDASLPAPGWHAPRRSGSSRSRLPAHGRRRQGRRQTGYPAAAAYSTRRKPAG